MATKDSLESRLERDKKVDRKIPGSIVWKNYYNHWTYFEVNQEKKQRTGRNGQKRLEIWI